MNERTLQLYKAAHVTHTANDPSNNMPYETTVFSADKFAELIVRECLDLIQKEVSLKYEDGGESEDFMGGHYAGSLLARVKIKQHFGVEK